MKKLLFLAIGISLVSIGCKKELEPQESSIPLSADASAANRTASATTPKPVASPATPDVQSAAAPGALNPAHGQPGHRCDIAVGAPLNGTAAAPAPTTQTMQATVGQNGQVTQTTGGMRIAPTPATASAKTAPGMNPAHGQPGHRCDIAVGAPLNSKPQKAEAKPAVASTTAAPGKTAPGMNPAHGQPGHRCDIAVGAPLASAPGKAGSATMIGSDGKVIGGDGKVNITTTKMINENAVPELLKAPEAEAPKK